MAWFRIYAGLGGGFGGANDQGIYQCEDAEEATNLAYEMAKEEYESYEGLHGLLDWEDCRRDLEESWPDMEWTDDDVADRYQEELESWLDFWVEEVSEELRQAEKA